MRFTFSDVLDYVKTGMASIIEDEVTQRFVAEVQSCNEDLRRLLGEGSVKIFFKADEPF